jgi:hypothetical protein
LLGISASRRVPAALGLVTVIRPPRASMAEVAGAAWSPEYELAWTVAFGVVAGAMFEGAEQAKLEAAA